ncbi:TIGR04255 family protein [Streptomyces tritici]|uniref:TIGR04255 family protein n=1 Tax=Streptomyces tritici TaxID=2054410 RepID=UPI003AF173E1
MDRRTYRNPPIVEALCTINFSAGRPWNITIPGRFYEEMKGSYPDEPTEERQFQARFEAQGTQAAQFKVDGAATRLVLKNEEKRVSIAPNALGVHALAPYEGWESLRERTLAALDSYFRVVGDQGIESIGIRYINRIFLPGPEVNFNDYFTIMQGLPANGFPGGITSFFDRMEVAYEDIPAKIVFTWASDDNVADRVAFIMDFDLTRQGPIDRDEVPNFLDDLRVRERLAFESLIQDKLRDEVFDADN